MTTLMKLKRLSWLVIFTLFLAEEGFTKEKAQNNNHQIDLLLAGGTLPICSSFSQKNCSDETFSSDSLTALLYLFDQISINTFQQTEFYDRLTPTEKVNINSLISFIYKEKGNESISKKEISTLLKKSKYRSTFLQMSDPLYFALFDFFEVQQLGSNNQRKREQVDFINSRNESSKTIFRTFYQQANQRAIKKGRNKPNILVVTASSRDPFESADFYLGIFDDFAANAEWLPLDSSLQQAIETERCDQLETIRQQNYLYDRARIYPKRANKQLALCNDPNLLLTKVKHADGIFFNGGDQSRTLAALTTGSGAATDVLELIQSLVSKHQLIVAGTSAGTAVQAGGEFLKQKIAMVTNGDPEFALSRGAFSSSPPSARCSETGSCQDNTSRPGDLTYLQSGGTGLFNLGLLDTHFSERDREIRLAVLALSTESRFGFGVDETTALAVSYLDKGVIEMEAIGENGVFIIDAQAGSANFQPNSANHVSGISYYLNEGDAISFDPLSDKLVTNFSSNSQVLAERQKARFKPYKHGEWRAQIAQMCGTNEAIKWKKYNNIFAVKASANTRFAINDKQQCSYQALPFVISQ